MNSKLKELLNMKNQPVAVLKTETAPEGAMGFRPGTMGACLVGMLEAASKGRTAAFTEDTCGCGGGRTGLGFAPMDRERIVPFLSTGTAEMPGEHYKKTPALVEAYADSLPAPSPAPCLVFKPLDRVTEDEAPVSVVFLVNADELSGLVTLANFDRSDGDAVQVRFGAGCAQAVLFAMTDGEAGRDRCTIGLTDPSGRLHFSRDLLSFAIPWKRFLEMEANAEESFLTKETWTKLRARIE